MTGGLERGQKKLPCFQQIIVSSDEAVENSSWILVKPGAANYLSREAPEPFVSAGDGNFN